MLPTFIGWIPTITGNLSFSLVGTSRTPKKNRQNYRTIANKKFTLAIQRRAVSDRIWPNPSFIGKYTFVYMAFSDLKEQHSLNHGYAFLIPDCEFWRFSYLFDDLSQRTEECRYQRLFFEVVNSMKCRQEASRPLIVRSVVSRRGEARLQFDGSREDAAVICTQAFYFIRDIYHTHQHHEPTSDTILKAYDNDALQLYGNSNWKRETLYALHKFIIQQKRERSSVNLVRAKGVLAYAAAFYRLHVKGKTDSMSRDVPRYLYEPVFASLTAADDEAQLKRGGSLFNVAAFFSLPLLLSTMTVVLGYEPQCIKTASCEISFQQRFQYFLHEFFARNFLILIASPLAPFVFFICIKINIRYLLWRRVFRDLQRILLSAGFVCSLALLGSALVIGSVGVVLLAQKVFS